MTKIDIVEMLYEKLDLPRKEVDLVVAKIVRKIVSEY